MARPEKGTKKVTSVWLEPEIEGQRDKIKMFYCYNCRVPLIQYTGNIATIVPGRQPYEPSTILKCKGSIRRDSGDWEECGQYFSFVAAVYTKNSVI